MLSDEVIERVTERVIERIEKVNTDILRQIGGNLDEIGKLTSTQAMQLVQTLKYGGDYNKIVKELAKVSKLTQKEVKEIFNEVAKNDYKFAEQFYNYRNMHFIPYDENVALKNEVKAIANITADRCAKMINPRVLGYGLVNKKTGDIEFKGLKKTYYELLDEAVLSVSQGKETFDQAMRKRIKEMGGGGLKVIYDSTYINKDGIEVHNSRRLDSAIRMNIKDSLRELHNETQRIFGEDFNADGVEISVHESPAPDHELVQGRQFSNIEFDKFQNDERAITYDGMVFEPDYEGHDRRSIGEYNCYHYIFSIILGVSMPEYDNDQLQAIIDRNNKGFELDGKHYTTYEGTQMQRQLETAIRQQKDIQIMAKASGQDDLVRESQQKITQLTQKYKELSQASGLPTKMQRLSVSGYTLYGRKRNNLEIRTPEPKKEYRTYEQLNLDADVWLENFEYGNPDKSKLNQEEKDTYNYFFKEFYEKFDMKDKEDVRKAIEDYTDENAMYNYRTLNPMLRSGSITKEAQEKIDLINEGTNMYEVPTNMLVYRGITGEKAVNRYLNVGSVVEEEGFLSTTVLKSDTDLFMEDLKSAMLEIEVDKGTKGLYIGIDTMSMAEQHELLFGTGKKLKVLGVEDIDKYTKKIKVKMIK